MVVERSKCEDVFIFFKLRFSYLFLERILFVISRLQGRLWKKHDVMSEKVRVPTSEFRLMICLYLFLYSAFLMTLQNLKDDNIEGKKK